ncbi:hypothetical protein [Methylibium sp.]|uniref:hypothetical protein n=1 Tax=Methylibium sp. TaxID=2067992 RepID=UPI003D1169BE
MKSNLLAWGVALAACMPLLAAAQAAKTEAPKAAPQLTYRSAFADYKPYKDAPLADWRQVNDTVAGAPGGASGHAGHSMNGMGGMKGMEAPAAPAPAASTPVPMKPRSGMPMHDGQHKHGGKQ